MREQNNDPINNQITGQYVQKELILDIASWISPEFYFKCNKRDAKFKELEIKMQNLETEKDEIIQEKSDKIDELIARMDQEREERQSKRKRMEEERQSDRQMLQIFYFIKDAVVIMTASF